LIWESEGRREQLIEELGEASRGLTAAAALVALAALILAMLPLAVLLSGASLGWLAPVLTSLAAVLTGSKLEAIVWGVIHGAQ
jgi:hypothetical protein